MRRAAAALGDGAARRPARPFPRPMSPPPKLPIEKGATLRMLRPARFVEPDEVIFRANTAKFAKETGVEVKVDFVGWEDIRQQTAVSANTGAGPDIILGWAEDPHIYADKVIELSDVAEYLGKKYGGWMFLGEKFGKKAKTNNWIGLPMGGSRRPDRLSQVGGQGSRLRQGPDRPCRLPQALPGAQEDQQAGGLRARQRGGRRQRLRQLDAVEPWRLPGR